MIIFINLKNQIIEGQSDFAFYDTISDKFLRFDHQEVFDTLEEFEFAHSRSYLLGLVNWEISRFVSLIPNGYFENIEQKDPTKPQL